MERVSYFPVRQRVNPQLLWLDVNLLGRVTAAFLEHLFLNLMLIPCGH